MQTKIGKTIQKVQCQSFIDAETGRLRVRTIGNIALDDGIMVECSKITRESYPDGALFYAVENSGDYLYGNIGGEYDYNYKYDDIYRLVSATANFTPYNQQPIGYKVNLDYSASGNILEKDVNSTKLINGGLVTVNYQNYYDYTGRPHTVTQAGDYLYSWDLNGNMTRRRDPDSDRYLCWDEENRLTAVRDVAHLSQSSIYIYDAGGERVWKLTGEEMLTQVNGQTVSSNIYFEKTLYTGPYLVMTESEYTKHYYIEGERVCSKIGGGFGPANVLPADSILDFIHGDAEHVAQELDDYCRRQLACVNYSDYYEWDKKLAPAGNGYDSLENLQYFYHPDHLGSAAVISHSSGRAYQHLQYFPFGELFVSQRNSSFDSRYKFSAKELDNETGYSYFGARYYDSDLSSWLSVDPLASKYPSLSPYAYCAGNPVGFIDRDGRDIVPTNSQGDQAIRLYLSKFSKETQIKAFDLKIKKGSDKLRGEYSVYSTYSKSNTVSKDEFIGNLGKRQTKGMTSDELNEAYNFYLALKDEKSYQIEGWQQSQTYQEGTLTYDFLEGYSTRYCDNNLFSEDFKENSVKMFDSKRYATDSRNFFSENFNYYVNYISDPYNGYDLKTNGLILINCNTENWNVNFNIAKAFTIIFDNY